MLRTIFTASIAAAILAITAKNAVAQIPEMDNEKAYTNVSSDATKATVVLKVDNRTGAVSILNGGAVINNNNEAQNIAKTGNFIALSTDKVLTAPKTEYEESNTKTAFYIVRAPGFYPNYAYGAYYGGIYNTFWAQPTYAYGYNDCSYYYYNNNNLAWASGWDGLSSWGGLAPYYGNTAYGFGWNIQPVYSYGIYGGFGWGGNYFGGARFGGYGGWGGGGGYGFGINRGFYRHAR